jgi:hypothetical protein
LIRNEEKAQPTGIRGGIRTGATIGTRNKEQENKGIKNLEGARQEQGNPEGARQEQGNKGTKNPEGARQGTRNKERGIKIGGRGETTIITETAGHAEINPIIPEEARRNEFEIYFSCLSIYHIARSRVV